MHADRAVLRLLRSWALLVDTQETMPRMTTPSASPSRDWERNGDGERMTIITSSASGRHRLSSDARDPSSTREASWIAPGSDCWCREHTCGRRQKQGGLS